MSNKSHTHRVFVYGTLKSGHGNNRVMFENGGDARLLGRAISKRPFFMADGGFPRAGLFVSPKWRATTDMQGQIIGEVWEVNKQAFDNMDRLEGHPRFYTRSKHPFLIDGQKREVVAWIYLIANGNLEASSLIKPVDGKVEWTHSKPFPRGWEYADA